ncbi:KTSC domain-containing protein [Acetoanaerobium noterae]|uniref:KTSC domain-containing protein n=1 Tax=Acetoanaerobium noterae TaxID=745369 RepID=UPI003242C7C0
MNMIPVSSSNLSAVGYENGTLYVSFHSGGLYSYANVPESVHKSLMSAGSKGSYFAAHIKNFYSTTKHR